MTDPEGVKPAEAADGDSMPAEAAPEHHSATAPLAWYRRKSILVLAALLFAAVAFGASTQTWLHVSANQGAIRADNIAIPGSKAATAVTALTLVSAAGALALSISGRLGRIIAGSIVFLAGIGVAATAIAVLADPKGSANGPLGAQIGVTGIPIEASTTPLVWVALVAGVLLTFTAIAVLVWGRNWAGSKKYSYRRAAEAQPEGEPLDDIDSWDRLSRGDDPTNPQRA